MISLTCVTPGQFQVRKAGLRMGVGVLFHKVTRVPRLMATLPSSTRRFHHCCGCFHLSQPDKGKGARRRICWSVLRARTQVADITSAPIPSFRTQLHGHTQLHGRYIAGSLRKKESVDLVNNWVSLPQKLTWNSFICQLRPL